MVVKVFTFVVTTGQPFRHCGVRFRSAPEVNAREFLEKIRRLRVLVVGDVCLDHWCYYDPALSIPSAETGIPRLAVTHSELTPGAAGTVANNLRSLGAHVSVLGLIGQDGHGYELARCLTERGIESQLVIQEHSVPTFTYTKVINEASGVEDKPRVDFVFSGDIPGQVEERICDVLVRHAPSFDLICVSDQAETERGGVITAAVRERLSGLASGGLLVWVDSRRRIELFQRMFLKMNKEEALAALQRSQCETAESLRAHTEAPALFITRGGEGVDIVSENGLEHIETRRMKNPVNICGAGDSFTVGAASALAIGATGAMAARLGHLVASVTIMKKGTGVALPGELMEAERNQGTATEQELKQE
jgi:rfaE bifunctional protein kinase chain/domain